MAATRTWTKLPVELLLDRNIRKLPRGTQFMHVEALVFCNANGTDGALDEHDFKQFTSEPRALDAARRLVDAGVWEVTETGFQIVDFTKDQRRSEDVGRTQELAAVRQRRQTQHRGGDHSLCDPKYCEQARVARDARAAAERDAPTSAAQHRTDPSGPSDLLRNDSGGGREEGQGAAKDNYAARPAPAGASAAARSAPLDIEDLKRPAKRGYDLLSGFSGS